MKENKKLLREQLYYKNKQRCLEYNKKKYTTRKERNAHLYSLGALFELIGMDKEDYSFLLGYLLLSGITKVEKKDYQKYINFGETFIKERNKLLIEEEEKNEL